MYPGLDEIVVGLTQAAYSVNPIENAEKSYKLIKKYYREADIVVLPEYSMLNPLEVKDPARVYELSEYLANSRYLSYFFKLASEIDAYILLHFIERTDKPPLTKSTSVIVTSKGEAFPVYNKMHLFDAYGYRESDYFEPGRGPGKLTSISGVEVAFAICYDIRFPELFRVYAHMGAKVIILQSGWVKGPLKEEILDKLASVRAHENGVYLVVVNQTGGMFTGRSGVFNPWGYKELDLGFEEKYIEYTLNLENVVKARETVPVIRQASEKWEVKLKS